METSAAPTALATCWSAFKTPLALDSVGAVEVHDNQDLDAEAEHDLMVQLLVETAVGTTLRISHRLNEVRLASKICVIRDGVTIESGSHERLMQHGGAYANLFWKQAAGYQL